VKLEQQYKKDLEAWKKNKGAAPTPPKGETPKDDKSGGAAWKSKDDVDKIEAIDKNGKPIPTPPKPGPGSPEGTGKGPDGKPMPPKMPEGDARPSNFLGFSEWVQ
jgi:hypothetical protein